MNYSDKLLEQSYYHYFQTLDRHFEYPIFNSDDLLRCMESCQNLKEAGYISNVSENMFSTVDLVPDVIASFDITDLGIEYIDLKLKTQT